MDRLARVWWVTAAALAMVVVHLAYKHSFYSGDSHLVATGGATTAVACAPAPSSTAPPSRTSLRYSC
jgi:hypothetical protein